MSATRKKGKATSQVGVVNVYAPTTTRAHWRLDYYQNGKRKFATGGNTESEAMANAERINNRLAKGSGQLGEKTLRELLEEYSLAIPKSRRTRKDLARTTFYSRRTRLARVFEPFMSMQCREVDRVTLDKMRAFEQTDRQERGTTTDLREILAWGASRGYFSIGQAECLPRGCIEANSIRVSTRPNRREQEDDVSGEQGDDERLITEEHAPTWSQVDALAQSMQKVLSWGRLVVELAASSGLRWGELFGLQRKDINVQEQSINVSRQAISLAKQSRFGPPKNKKRRSALYPSVSPTGFALGAALVERLNEISQEGNALLFPTLHGHVWWHGAFSTDFFGPAAETAGWERQHWKELDRDGIEVNRQQWKLTWHSLRHRFALTAKDSWGLSEAELCKIGGWASPQVVFERYYRSSEEHQESAREKMLKINTVKSSETTSSVPFDASLSQEPREPHTYGFDMASPHY